MATDSDKTYFNVRIEFDQEKFDRIVFDAIERGHTGYSCSVEANNLTVANKDPEFLRIINGALVNNCDGSVLAKILAMIHREKIDSYIGADIFLKYIGMKRFRQFFLGNTPEVLAGLKSNLTKIDPSISGMRFETLPFAKVEDFDYQSIADMINADNPDIVWVSLGAPKQEQFMARLAPLLNRGVLFGYGAIFNFNAGVGKVKRAPRWMLNKRLEWLYRAVEEPRKNIPRYFAFVRILPRLISRERKKVREERLINRNGTAV